MYVYITLGSLVGKSSKRNSWRKCSKAVYMLSMYDVAIVGWLARPHYVTQRLGLENKERVTCGTMLRFRRYRAT